MGIGESVCSDRNITIEVNRGFGLSDKNITIEASLGPYTRPHCRE
jgi:hypothetical protein